MPVEPLTIVSSQRNPASISFARRLRDRRWVAQQDRTSSQLAEMHVIRALLADATRVVRAGWIQHGWFSYVDEAGHQRLAGSYDLRQLTGRPVTGACVVGAIVQAGGGPMAAHTQPVHRALDLTWHALFRAESYPVGYCPAPDLRVARTRELTAWNDRPHRRVQDVTALLGVADRMAVAAIERLHRTQAGAELVV